MCSARRLESKIVGGRVPPTLHPLGVRSGPAGTTVEGRTFRLAMVMVNGTHSTTPTDLDILFPMPIFEGGGGVKRLNGRKAIFQTSHSLYTLRYGKGTRHRRPIK
jgi:hypothetical protein